MSFKRGLWTLFLFLLLLTVVLGWLSPRVIAFAPAGTGPWPAFTPLRVRFSRPMTADVASALSFRPAVAGELSWEGNTLIFTPTEPWPVGEVQVSLPAGVRSAAGLPTWRSWQAAFQVAAPQLVFLWPHKGPADLYALDPTKGQTRRLTETAGVLDYTVDTRGLFAVLSVRNPQGGADLQRWDRLSGEIRPLLTCGPDTCQSPTLSPDGDIAYLRGRHLWLLPSSGEPRPVSAEGERVTWAAWSPDGWLAWYDATAQVYRFLGPAGEHLELASQTGEAGAWLPPGADFIFPELFSTPAHYTSHLLRFNRALARTVDLSRDDTVEDFDPLPAPDGTWIAFTRKYLDEARWTPGRQLWLMRPDGSQAHPLTDAPNFHHRMLAWAPQGDRLAFVRVNQTDLGAPPELWLYDLSTQEATRLWIGGLLPQWMP